MNSRALALTISLLALTSCGKGEPTKGEAVQVPFPALFVPVPAARQVPLDIIHGQMGDSPLAMAERLQAGKFQVALKTLKAPEFQAITDNKINTVVASGIELQELRASRETKGRDTGITETITAKYMNGLLMNGSWTSSTWVTSSDASNQTQKMEVSSAATDKLLRIYQLPPLKGEQAQNGLGGLTWTIRKSDEGQRCMAANGAVSSDQDCQTGVVVSYRASYTLQSNHNDICWEGICTLQLDYADQGFRSFETDLSNALAKAYRDEFGEINPPQN